MKKTFLIIAFLVLFTANSFGQKVDVIGLFLNVKSDGEHASGYDVKLWKHGENICGLINAHRGLMGDPPTGILENVKFDKKTGKLSFTAKLSLAVTEGKKVDEWIPTHDLFEFDGILSKKTLKGKLKITDKTFTKFRVITKTIKLPFSTLWKLDNYKNYASWKKYANDILKTRGPKW
jgi:hypothetical protein